MITILGTGQVGRNLFHQLRAELPQSEILLVNKSGKVSFDLPTRTEVLSLDVTKKANLIRIFQESEIVFSCTDVSYELWGDFYPLLSEAMVEGLLNSNTKLVFADNMYSYGNLKGQVMYEGLLHTATTKKGKIRAHIINNFISNGVSHRVAIVKSSDFIGPSIEKGIFGLDFLKKIYNHKTVFLPGRIDIPHHFTFIEDFAKALLLVAFEPNAYGQIWHVPSSSAISQSEWINVFKIETGLKIKFRSVPNLMVKLIGLFNPFVREFAELSYQFTYPYLVDSEKFISHFGDISTPHIQVVKDTIRWFELNELGQ